MPEAQRPCERCALAGASIIFLATLTQTAHAGGAHWTTGGPRAGIVAIALAPSDSQVIYAGSTGIDGGKGVYKSVDGGRHWAEVNEGITNKRINALAVDPRNPKIAYAGYEGEGFYRTTDGGGHWARINRMSLHHGTSIAIDPADSDVLYLGTDKGMFKSTDAGQTVIQLKNGQPEIGTVVNIVFDPHDRRTLYISRYNEKIEDSGVWKSTDAGASWSAVNTGLAGGPKLEMGINRTIDSARLAFGLAIDPKHSDVVFVGTLGGGVFKTTDGGRHWKPANDGINTGMPSGNSVYSLAVDPRDTDVIYAGSAGGGVFKTTDGGKQWAAYSDGLPAQNDHGRLVGVIWALQITPDGKVLYAGNYGDANGVYSTAAH